MPTGRAQRERVRLPTRLAARGAAGWTHGICSLGEALGSFRAPVMCSLFVLHTSFDEGDQALVQPMNNLGMNTPCWNFQTLDQAGPDAQLSTWCG